MFDALSAEEKDKYAVAYEEWRSRQPQDVLDKLDGAKKSPTSVAKPIKKVSPPTKKAILAKAKAAAGTTTCFAPMPDLDDQCETITDTDDFALLSDDELSAEDLDDLFPMPELVANAFGMVTGGVPAVAGGFESAPLQGMGSIEAFPIDDSLMNFLTEFD